MNFAGLLAGTRLALRGRSPRLSTPVVVALCFCILILAAAQATIANLPANKVFAGHDSGFYNLFPDQLIRTSSGTWEVKSNLGFPNFQAMGTLPYALIVVGLHHLHLTGSAVGRALYFAELLTVQLGAFVVAWLVLARSFGASSAIRRSFAALLAALAAGYNIFTAVLLLYPPSGFQLGILCWPAVVALELYFLWRAPRLSAAISFALALWFATIGNPATTMLGLSVVLAVYLFNAFRYRAWHWRYVTAVTLIFFLGTSYLWLPAVAALFLYHGAVSAPEAVDAASLLQSQQGVAVRASLGALARFDGLRWWPELPNSGLYDSAPMIIATYVPMVLAIVALTARTTFVRMAWAGLIVALWFAKSVHPPLGLNMVWLMTHVPLLAAYREGYDKFMVVVVILLPPLSAVGMMVVWRSRYGKGLAITALMLVAFAAWPFLAGRIAEPYFLTTVPQDYRRVDELMGSAPDTRVLSFPGGASEIHVTNWFKGGNFENLMYHAKVLNAAMFKARSISAAPYYDDYHLVQPSELPDLISALGLYHVSYVILHKDYLTTYRMAFDYQPYKVLGPQIAAAARRVLDNDRRLKRIFEGPHLILYRVVPSASLPYAYGTYDAGLQIGFENTLLGSAQASILDAQRHPVIFFSGNMNLSQRAEVAATQTKLMAEASYLVDAPLIPERAALYREQIALQPEAAERVAQAAQSLVVPTYYIFEGPHGDWPTGPILPQRTIDGQFTASTSQTVYPKVIVRADRVPREVAFFRPASRLDHPWIAGSFRRAFNVSRDFADGRVPGLAEVQQSIHPLTSLENSGATYDVNVTQLGNRDELMIARGPLMHIAMIDDPRITFDYAFSQPSLSDAWLRFKLTTTSGERVYLDRQLDATGVLEDYDIRDALQVAIDHNFDESLKIHQTDPQWVASLEDLLKVTQRPRFNPEQAEQYKLSGISLIFGKTAGAHLNSTHIRFLFRDLQIVALGEPAYRRPLISVPFALKRVRIKKIGFRSSSASTSHGALIVVAVAAPSKASEQTPVGHAVTFAMKDGGRLTAHVLGENSEYYTVIIADQSHLIFKRSIESILAIGNEAEYQAQVDFPPIDPRRTTNFRIRYFQKSNAEQVSVRLLVTSHGHVSGLIPGLAVPPNSATLDVPPTRWTTVTGFPGSGTPISLNSRTVRIAPDTGWHQLSFDLRRVAAYRIPDLSARIVGAQVKFDVATSPSESTFGFGFGDVTAFEQVNSIRAVPPNSRALSIDGRARSSRSADAIGGDPSELKLNYGKMFLAQGAHRIVTNVDEPWTVQSVVIAPRFEPRSFPVSITPVDNELFAAHLSNDRAGWLAFAESFHGGWQLIPGEAPESRWRWVLSLRWLRGGIAEHLVGNAYNNTWRVPRGGNYVIDFAPQDFALAGEFTSFAVLVIAVIGALASVINLRPRK